MTLIKKKKHNNKKYIKVFIKILLVTQANITFTLKKIIN